MFQPQLGVSFHTLAPICHNQLLGALSESGIKTLEIMSSFFDAPESQAGKKPLQNILLEKNISVKTIHCSFGGNVDISSLDPAVYDSALQNLHVSLDLAREWHAPIVVLHGSWEPIAPEQRPTRLRQAIAALQTITPRCRKDGCQIAVELLPRTCLGNTGEELETILATLDPQYFGVCLDVNHLMDQYRTIPALVHRLGKKLLTLHLSDYDGVDEKHWLPGQGVIDWPAFMQALRDIDYQGPFNYECSFPQDAAPAKRLHMLTDNFQRLRGL